MKTKPSKQPQKLSASTVKQVRGMRVRTGIVAGPETEHDKHLT
jgi:hypothetical protein